MTFRLLREALRIRRTFNTRGCQGNDNGLRWDVDARVYVQITMKVFLIDLNEPPFL